MEPDCDIYCAAVNKPFGLTLTRGVPPECGPDRKLWEKDTRGSDSVETSSCTYCGKATPSHRNFCSWECQVAEARKVCGKEILPNGLPVSCIRADGSLLEHEHGDHPDYKFPVVAEYDGPIEDVREVVSDPAGGEPAVFDFSKETHALIYTDGFVALTMYEACYSLWRLNTGRAVYMGTMPFDKLKSWKLTAESVDAIRKLNTLSTVRSP